MEKALQFLSGLSQNNDRAWFHAHKAQYQEATAAFEALVGRLMDALRRVDGNIPQALPRELTFKLMRDTRFSHDKSPYHPAFRAHIGPSGKLPIPVGYYIMVSPGGRSFLGGGLFADMFKDATARIRDAIAAQGDAWARIVSDPAFQAYFTTVRGTALKNVPRGYDPAHPQAEYFKYKSFYVEYPLADAQVLDDGFVASAVQVFQAMQPFHAFLNQALEGFEMPKRA